MIVAHALQHEQNGRARLDSLTATIKAGLRPFPGMTTLDSIAMPATSFWELRLERIAGAAALLNRPAPAIWAHTWMNVPTPTGMNSSTNARRNTSADTGANTALSSGASAKSLADGTVRLILFGTVNCCAYDMIALQRLRESLPTGADMLIVSGTSGYINGQLVTPAEEIAALKTVYRDELRLTVPVALWGAPKHGTTSGGAVPTPSPNIKEYSIPDNRYGSQDGDPYLLIVDARGIVRHLFAGITEFSRDDERRALSIIRDLLAHN
jgi:hypothetical protein